MSGASRDPKTFRIAAVASLVPLGIFCLAAWLCPRVAAGEVFSLYLEWIPSLDVELAFQVDGLSLLFVLVICCVGFFVGLYAVDYLGSHPQAGRFYFFLHSFMLAMLGLVLADNLLLLFVFWELTTLFSYLLIGFEHESESARGNARQALLVTGAGGLALLIGFLLLKSVGGTSRISELGGQAALIRQDALYLPILLTVFLGAFTKSAQFPFHFWLPNAMSAPTPISAFLHSATMVKAGIYLLARLHPVLGGTPAWMGTLVIVGGVTALIGALQALTQSDLKRILAYTTIMALGILTMFLGGRATPALTAAMTFFLVHSLYKSALFLVAGIIDHQTGTRRLEALGGLRRPMPLTAFATAAAALSMAGFPLFFGFIGKEIMYKGALAEDMFPEFATAAALLSNSLMTAVAGILFIRPFMGPRANTPHTPREATAVMWIGPVIMGGLDIVFGVVPEWVARWLVEPAVKAFHPTDEPIGLTLYHGINPPLLLSVVTLSLGALIYRQRQRIRRALEKIAARQPLTAQDGYTACLDTIGRLAALQTRILQNGSLHRYLAVVVTAVVLFVGIPLFLDPPAFARPAAAAVEQPAFLIVFITAAAVMLVLNAHSRLLAICALGVTGAGVAMLFLIYGAPDVALTQLLVETLTVIIATLVLLRLPRFDPRPSRKGVAGWLNGLLAVSAGALVTALVLAVCSHPLDRSLTEFFEAASYTAAHGRNIVNVILVDFRSLDTLGEITVVAVAGVSACALIRR
jgi:multicomponent Na+:H+ antiporter subunit A